MPSMVTSLRAGADETPCAGPAFAAGGLAGAFVGAPVEAQERVKKGTTQSGLGDIASSSRASHTPTATVRLRFSGRQSPSRRKNATRGSAWWPAVCDRYDRRVPGSRNAYEPARG